MRIGETERMAAVATDVLGVAAAAGDEANAVGGEKADQGMADPARHTLRLQKRMTAEAGVLREPVTVGDVPDLVAKEPAPVADLLGEDGALGKRVRCRRKNERMTAAHADVLVVAVAVDQANVGVVAEKAGQRVADARERAVLAEIWRAAAALPAAVVEPAEGAVVDRVSPDATAQPRYRVQRHLIT